MTHAMLSQTALVAQLANDPRYKALLVEFEAKAKESLTEGKFTIESLGGVEMTLPEVAPLAHVRVELPIGDILRHSVAGSSQAKKPVKPHSPTSYRKSVKTSSKAQATRLTLKASRA